MIRKLQGKFALRWAKNKKVSYIGALVAVSGSAIVGTLTLLSSSAATTTPNVTVNFNNTVATLPSYPFGSTISTYGGQNITTSPTQVTNLKNLNLSLYRIPLYWNNGTPLSSAGGSSTTISATAWIQALEQQVGTQPEIIIGGGTTSGTQFNTVSPTDAASMVSYFNTPGTNHYLPVKYWIIGNEPDTAGLSAASYCAMYNSMAQQMTQAAAAIATQYGATSPGATIQIGGPALAWNNTAYMQSFLSCVNPAYLNFVDFHQYAMGNPPALTNAQAFSQADSYKSALQNLRGMLSSTLGSAANNITTQIGEYNWSWQFADGYQGSDAWDGTGNDVRFFEPVTTAWSAAAIGNIAETGSRSFQHSDQNGPLGITFDDSEPSLVSYYGQAVNSPMPIYWGIGMYSGANLFRGFGSTVVSSSVTSLPNVETFASTNSDNVVLVNEDPTTTQVANVSLSGFGGGIYDAWQTCGTINSGISCTGNGQFSAPTKIVNGQVVSNDAIPVSLPPYSVTTLVLYPTVAPVISAVASTNVTSTASTINWTTDQNATSQVLYGTTSAYGTTTPLNTTMATSHSATLTGLTPGTIYHYSVLSTNASNQTTTSADYTFTTSAATISGPIVGIASKCVDDSNSAFTNNNTVYLYGCNGTNAQKWTLYGDGTIRIDNNLFCLDTKNGGTASGTIAVINTCTGASSQQWVGKSNSSLVNTHSGLCLDDRTSGTGNGNPIQIYSCNGTNAQVWKLP
jgi:hypothetical protein